MDKLTFYFDRNVGKRLPYALAKLNPPIDIRWQQGEAYAQDMPDDVWLELVATKNWIVLSQDKKFHRIDAEIEAIKQHGAKCFYIPGANSPMWDTACSFVRLHKQMIELAKVTPAPFIISFSVNGRWKRLL